METYAPYSWLKDSYALVQRIALSGSLPATPAAATTVTFANIQVGVNGPAGCSFNLGKTQAARFVKASMGRCFATAPVTTFLSCQSSLLAVTDANGVLVRGWQGNYSGNTLGLNGQGTSIVDDEVLISTDYLALGDQTGNFFIFYQVDVRNTDAAPHNFQLSCTVLVEIWDQTPTSRMRG